MATKCFIGLDQGSSSTKAIVISEAGQVLFQVRRPLPPPSGEGDRVEYDALSILESLRDLVKEAVQSVQAAGFVPAGIGLSCQRSSCLLWDESTGEPLSPVISWRDRRGAEFVEQIQNESPFIFESTGLPLTPYYSASKLRWLKENLPAARKDGPVLGTLSSFLVQRLTSGERALIDHTHAARTQLMNIATLAWDPKLLELFGLSEARLPGIVPVIHDFGNIATTAGPVPLVVCIGDQQAATTGLGVLERGDGGINYGTGGFLMVNTGSELVTAKGLMASILFSTQRTRHYLLEGSVNAAGDALEWIRSRMHLFNDYSEVDDLCWQAATDVVAFIGLNGTGAPHWEQDISTSFYGMTSDSTAADIVRGAVESIAFFMKDIAEQVRGAGLEPGSFSVSGGLSSLTYLVQVQADVLQRDLCVSVQQEVSALGAALLSGMARDVWSPAAIKKLVVCGETIAPRKNAGAEKRYRRWKELHRMTRTLDTL
jgi:glycerol kinase